MKFYFMVFLFPIIGLGQGAFFNFFPGPSFLIPQFSTKSLGIILSIKQQKDHPNKKTIKK
jgi:hypothetical protein